MTVSPATRIARLIVGVTTALVVGGATACSSSSDQPVASVPSTSATSTSMDMTADEMSSMPGMGSSTTSSTAGGQAAGDKVNCAQHMPGDLLTEEQAVVEFDHEHVCLAYVTVRPGTNVSWHNGDSADQTVTVFDSKNARVAELSVPAGQTVRRVFPEAGNFTFKIAAIDAFSGVVEVTTTSS